jgi:hypothetical protein
MSSLARPWRRWAVAAPASSFVIAVFVLAPGGIPAIGMPVAVEVGAGAPAGQAGDPGRPSPAPQASAGLPSGAPGQHGRGTSTGHGTSGVTRIPASRSSDGTVTVVSAQQPVVVTAGGGEPGDDGSGTGPTHTPGPSPSVSPSPSPAGSGVGGPGDE